MEGDLLEVCLDETQHLWRILNAAKPGSSDLTLLKKRYKIEVIFRHSDQLQFGRNTHLVRSFLQNQSPDDLVIRNPAHNNDDPDDVLNASQTTITPVATAAGRKSGKLNRSANASALNESAQSPLTPHNNSGAAGTPATGGSVGSNNTSNSNKLKRGRKLKMSTEKPAAAGAAAGSTATGPSATTPASLAAASAAAAGAGAAAAGGATAAAQKKKRGRKSVPENQNQTPTAASTSDEEEECSATNCVRPAGKSRLRILQLATANSNHVRFFSSAQVAKSTGCNAMAAATNGTTCTASVW